MSRVRGADAGPGPGRKVWQSMTPLALRRSAQPLVRRLMERRVNAALRAGEPELRAGPLIVSGLLSEAKGVSEGARLSLAAFRAARLGPVAHDLRPLFARGAAFPAVAPGGVWFLHVNAPEAIQAMGRIDPSLWRGRYRIGYWAYELPRAPAEWVRVARAFHEIWAPSRFVVDALRAAGVTTPVRLMPHPVTLGEPPAPADRAAFGIPDDAFAVLAMGDLNSSATRKNLEGAITAYVNAFPEAGRGRLLIKVREAGAYPVFLEQARRLGGERQDVVFLTEDLSAQDLRRLIASSNVVLSPHRAEGFGLSLAEAFLAGVPALATGWSGNLDFMTGVPELLIGHALTPVRDPYGVYRAPGQLWAEPDIADAADRLRRLAEAPGLRAELARRGAAAVEALAAAWSREALGRTELGRLAAGMCPAV